MVASPLGMALALPSLAMDALRDLPETAWAAAASMVSLAFHDGFMLVAVVCAVAAAMAWRNAPSGNAEG